MRTTTTTIDFGSTSRVNAYVSLRSAGASTYYDMCMVFHKKNPQKDGRRKHTAHRLSLPLFFSPSCNHLRLRRVPLCIRAKPPSKKVGSLKAPRGSTPAKESQKTTHPHQATSVHQQYPIPHTPYTQQLSLASPLPIVFI